MTLFARARSQIGKHFETTTRRYWYVQNETQAGSGGDNGAVFLGGALEDGFSKANNNQELEFALMWANQDWVDVRTIDNESALL